MFMIINVMADIFYSFHYQRYSESKEGICGHYLKILTMRSKCNSSECAYAM